MYFKEIQREHVEWIHVIVGPSGGLVGKVINRLVL
jgi:hypothetical protein